MTLRSRFFAMTYDRQMTKVEKAGLCAYRRGMLAGVAGLGARDRRRDGVEPALLRPGRRDADPNRARDPYAAPPAGARPVSRCLGPRYCAHQRRTYLSRTPPSTWRSSTLVLCGVDDQPRAVCGSCAGCSAPARRPASVHRARALYRPPSSAFAGPHERDQPVRWSAVTATARRSTPSGKLVLPSRAPSTRRCRRAPKFARGPLWAALRFLSGAKREARRRKTGMTVAAARCRRFLRQKQPGGANPAAPDSQPSAVMTRRVWPYLPQVLTLSGREGTHQAVLGGVERRGGAGGYAELAVDVLDVVGRRLRRDHHAWPFSRFEWPRATIPSTSTSRVVSPPGQARRAGT